jgi:hypothetical protein
MSISKKYGRTYHYPFSPGTTSDDRINHQYWDDLRKIETVIHTEKLDGENTCMNGIGIFARSHAAPTLHPWADHLKPKFSMIQEDLRRNDIELFGENLYAVHSILYPNLPSHFFMFGVRSLDTWLSWEEVCWYADFFEFPVVPLLDTIDMKSISCEEEYKRIVHQIISKPSVFGSIDSNSGLDCTREGIVSRNINEYSVDQFKNNVFKYVRANHVKTDEHWTRAWKRAPLMHEKNEQEKGNSSEL